MQAFIYGSKSYAKLVAEIAIEQGYEIAGFIDDFSDNMTSSYDHLKRQIIDQQIPVFMGIGYGNLGLRYEVLRKLRTDGVELPNLIHSQAAIHSSVKLGVANIFMAGSFVDAFCEVGSGNVLWPHSMISHDTLVGDNNFLSPKALLCGFCNVGSSVFFGAGCIVVDNCKISDDQFIKAGELVKTKA